jgi:hypothetical protein
MKNTGIMSCIIIRCTGTYDKNLFSVLAPWWQSQESNWTEILSVGYSYLMDNVLSQ